ncbi:hypothetical protein TTE2647 [Caldanaerobacter subterraneus subsp. tengcongensis MB4]|uniref:Uncharacterized protein n=1 Tax=Caldanaerobacter subterraneus subsp. tengcongensis (strain DSM 15242 / JCM 11007 / NBRC 100824 / MB4) TaxID=273068 RepID=Q8R6Y6_CALS4|nr:hypothetical protein TTE2647 [Caldanaerobacter subterraneus subsp. tengcongensis MB4]
MKRIFRKIEMFQSLLGRLKTSFNIFSLPGLRLFQSLLGRLKTWSCEGGEVMARYNVSIPLR